MIEFNRPPYVGSEMFHIGRALENRKISGDGAYSKECARWIEDRFGAKKALLTTSGTSALEMAALLCEFEPGDEVILPSYTFTSTATALAMAGASLVFVDVRPDTMNIDESQVENAITEKTKAICVVHYAGVSCEMNKILSIAKEHSLLVIEDAAQGFMSSYEGKHLGTIGDFGCFSFHETKNYSMGEGGAIVVNNENFIDRAEIIREKGTNRNQYFRGQVDKYTWVDIGSSYLPSDINAAHLYAQLEMADEILANRLYSWNKYHDLFSQISSPEKIELQRISSKCSHNAHMFYIKLPNLTTRTDFIKFMKNNSIQCAFHYVPLHSSPAGLRFGRFNGEDRYTTRESDRLVRLPLYYGMAENDVKTVTYTAMEFLEGIL